MKVLGVIPARGGSKSIPRKNLKYIAGKPLIAYVIETALKCRLLNRVIVSTEDKEIGRVAKSYGAEVPFLRPKELARDEVSIIPVVQHAMRYLEKNESWKADVIASIQPTSPLIEAADIDRAVNQLVKSRCDAVISVCKITHGHPFRALRVEGDKVIPLYRKGFRYLQKQDLPTLYMPNGALYVRRREILERWNGRDFALGKEIRAIIMDELKSINIDTPLDLVIVEAVIKKMKAGA